MDILRYFPIKQIEEESTVVLYGAGRNGRRLYDANSSMNWCKIKMVCDKRYDENNRWFDDVYSPLEAKGINFDYLLISILDKNNAFQAKEDLIKMGFDESKIIIYESHIEKIVSEADQVTIGFRTSGGMGDYIMQLKVYQAIIKLAPDCVMDVIAERPLIAEHIYYGQENLRNIIEGFNEQTMKEKYDLFIEMGFEIEIGKYDADKIEKLAPALKRSIDRLVRYNSAYYVGMPAFQYTNRILIERAKLMGWNRYTQWSCSGAFDIHDKVVNLNIAPGGENGFKGYDLQKKYITYNFGADDFLKDGKRQTKVWPFEYHEEFNKLFKQVFPDIMVIQLGGKDAEAIPGADKYIFGEDLEIVKMILTNSLLHFDCEGGLVHMATQLGTKCCVLFGPTPMWFLGYDENINIPSKECGECKGLIKQWYTTCYKYGRPECMYSIKPKEVMDKISYYLKSDSEYGV